MAMERHKRAVAITETYTARDGTEKKKYANIGTLFKFDDGGLMLKLDTVPIGKNWDGTIKFYDFDTDQKPARTTQSTAPATDYEFDDVVPF